LLCIGRYLIKCDDFPLNQFLNQMVFDINIVEYSRLPAYAVFVNYVNRATMYE